MQNLHVGTYHVVCVIFVCVGYQTRTQFAVEYGRDVAFIHKYMNLVRCISNYTIGSIGLSIFSQYVYFYHIFLLNMTLLLIDTFYSCMLPSL